MKKVLFVLLITIVLMTSVSSAQNFSISFTGNLLGPADADYKKVYGNTIFFPEIKAGYLIGKEFSIWAGFGLLSATGKTSGELQEEAKSTQNFLSLGLGYVKNIANKLDLKVEAGGVYIHYKEEALELVVKDSAIGFRVDLGFLYNLSSSFFLELGAGYIYATDEVTIDEETESITLGGFKAGAGVGIRF